LDTYRNVRGEDLWGTPKIHKWDNFDLKNGTFQTIIMNGISLVILVFPVILIISCLHLIRFCHPLKLLRYLRSRPFPPKLYALPSMLYPTAHRAYTDITMTEIIMKRVIGKNSSAISVPSLLSGVRGHPLSYAHDLRPFPLAFVI
jgi:hypothetical protein